MELLFYFLIIRVVIVFFTKHNCMKSHDISSCYFIGLISLCHVFLK